MHSPLINNTDDSQSSSAFLGKKLSSIVCGLTVLLLMIGSAVPGQVYFELITDDDSHPNPNTVWGFAMPFAFSAQLPGVSSEYDNVLTVDWTGIIHCNLAYNNHTKRMEDIGDCYAANTMAVLCIVGCITSWLMMYFSKSQRMVSASLLATCLVSVLCGILSQTMAHKVGTTARKYNRDGWHHNRNAFRRLCDGSCSWEPGYGFYFSVIGSLLIVAVVFDQNFGWRAAWNNIIRRFTSSKQ